MVLQHGVMFAASIWSLIIPGIEMEKNLEKLSWAPVSIGIILGVGFLLKIDSIVEKIMNKNKNYNKKNKMLNFAIIIHNIPEGMVVGIAFASSFFGRYNVGIMSALALAIGIAIQNFPEGMAISLPLKSEGDSRKHSFLIGTLSRNSGTNCCYYNNINK